MADKHEVVKQAVTILLENCPIKMLNEGEYSGLFVSTEKAANLVQTLLDLGYYSCILGFDESIFYFLPEDVISKSDKEITKYIQEN